MEPEDYWDDERYIYSYETLAKRRKKIMDLGENKYYMGTEQISASNKSLMTDLDGAIASAKKYLKNNPSCSHRYIVKVVKIVKRREEPVVVEDVE